MAVVIVVLVVLAALPLAGVRVLPERGVVFRLGSFSALDVVLLALAKTRRPEPRRSTLGA